MFQVKKKRGGGQLCVIFKANTSEKLINKTFNLSQLMCIPNAVSQVLENGQDKAI